MNFTEQCLAARRRIEQRLNIIRATCDHSWGLGRVNTQHFINQFALSSGQYGASAYFGLATQQGRMQLQTAYNKCLRVVTGCTNSTLITKLQVVAGEPSLDIKITRQACNLANIAKRHTNLTPSTYVLSTTVRQRICKDKVTWWQLAKATLPATPLQPLPRRPPPWNEISNLSIQYTSCMTSDLLSAKLATALECLRDFRTTCPSQALVEVLCDGSVMSEGEGGSGFIIVKCMDGDSEEVASGSVASGIIATSCTAESRVALGGGGKPRLTRSLRRPYPRLDCLSSATVDP